MATTYGNRMRVAVATTGTGTVNLGNALTNFKDLSSLTTGSTIGYALDDLSNGAWEVGTGVYTSGSPSTVTRVLESSSTGSSISLSGSATLMVTETAAQILSYAPLASPGLTGTPTAPTAAATDDSTTLATTAYVTNAISPALGDIGRNKLHNPLFNIAQRGTGAFTTVVYTLDRWALSLTGDSDSVTQAALADADRTAIGDEEAEFALQNVFTGAAGSGNFSVVIQRIEDVKRLSNKTVTVSFWAKAASGAPKLGVALDQAFGSGGSAAVQGTGQAVTLSTSWTRFTLQFTLGSASGKTIGAGSFTGLDFWYSAGSTFNTRTGSIGTQGPFTVSLWGVQLEIGSVATQLEKPDPRYDLSNCQRFYTIGAVLAASTGSTGSTLFAQSAYPVTMRASPTVVGTNNSSSNVTSPNAVNSSAYPTGVVVGTGTCTASGAYQLNVTYTASADL